ncbi:MAG TPA: VOC family protein [Opitutaceae bacterium]
MSTSTATATKPTTPSAPRFHTVTPHIICAGAAQAIEFYKKAFGAQEMMRLAAPDGKLIHASIQIGDSIVMMVDEIPAMGCVGPIALKGTPVTIHLQIDNADAWQKRAVDAGAKLLMPVQDMFWGDRYGVVEDPFGHRWSIAHHVRPVSHEELQKAAMSMTGPCPS